MKKETETETKKEKEPLVTFICNDKENARISTQMKYANKSKFVASMMEVACPEDQEEEGLVIPLPNTSINTMRSVIEFFIALETNGGFPADVEWPLATADMYQIGILPVYVDYIKRFDLEGLYNLILAADYMDIPELALLARVRFASDIMNKTTSELKKEVFGIEQDMPFTDEEFRLVERDNDEYITRSEAVKVAKEA